MYGYDNDGMGGWMWLAVGYRPGRRGAGGDRRPGLDRRGRRRASPRSGAGGERTRHSAARRILDERYARGELDTKEYRERVQTLGG